MLQAALLPLCVMQTSYGRRIRRVDATAVAIIARPVTCLTVYVIMTSRHCIASQSDVSTSSPPSSNWHPRLGLWEFVSNFYPVDYVLLYDRHLLKFSTIRECETVMLFCHIIVFSYALLCCALLCNLCTTLGCMLYYNVYCIAASVYNQ